jgi:hypothetical protein
MPVFMKGNYIFVAPGQKCFEISSNFTNYLELGTQGITPYYLEARIEEEEFRISGILLDKNGGILCRLKDNFIESSQDCNKDMTQSGYRIRDRDGILIFEIHVENDTICRLKGTIYGAKGEIVAQDKEGEFVILKGPAILGKSGSSIGIKLN